MKNLGRISSVLAIVSCVSCVHSEKAPEGVAPQAEAVSERDPAVAMARRAFKDVCQLDQSGQQNHDACQKAHPGKHVRRELYKEYPSVSPEEIKDIAQQVVLLFQNASEEKVAAMKAPGELKENDVNYDARLRRVTHSKMHACAVGQLTIAENVPDRLKVGIFASPSGSQFKTYSRFANGTSFVNSDLEPDARAHSFKVIGVPGAKLALGAEADTNMDFLMNNSPVFFVKGPRDFLTFFNGVFGQGIWGYLPRNFFLGKFFKLGGRADELKAVQDLQSRMPKNLLAEKYYSGIPIRWGSIAVKYGLKPVPCEGFEKQGSYSGTGDQYLNEQYKSGPDFYRASVAQQLEKDSIPACWEFGVQEQKDPWTMPIEDTTIAWSEEASPFVTIARLKIHPQEIVNEQKLDFCDNLSLNPWRVPEEFRPLGDLSKLRREAYYISSKGRHEHNQTIVPGVEFKEPNGSEWQ